MNEYFVELDLNLISNPEITSEIQIEQCNTPCEAVLGALIKYGEAVVGVYTEEDGDINGPHDTVAMTHYTKHGV